MPFFAPGPFVSGNAYLDQSRHEKEIRVLLSIPFNKLLPLVKIIKNEASQEILPHSDRFVPTYRLLSPFLNRSTDGC